MNSRLAAVAAAIAAAPLLLLSQSQSNSLLPQWTPTELPAGRTYAGSDTCIKCHSEHASALTTAMGDALQRPRGSEFLKDDARWTFQNGPYRYEIQGDSYLVTDGDATISAPIVWSFGHGKAGQTYVLERDGQLYESRVSYYLAINGLDQTLGAPPGSVPTSLDEAFGRTMTPDDIRGCFGCHATGVVRDGQVAIDELVQGIQCEGCHGPGEAHLEAVSTGQLDDLRIESHRDLSAEQESDFCGSCHRTWSQVVLMGLQGPANV